MEEYTYRCCRCSKRLPKYINVIRKSPSEAERREDSTPVQLKSLSFYELVDNTSVNSTKISISGYLKDPTESEYLAIHGHLGILLVAHSTLGELYIQCEK